MASIQALVKRLVKRGTGTNQSGGDLYLSLFWEGFDPEGLLWENLLVRGPLDRTLLFVLLVSWMTPGIAAFGMGLHVALDHHQASPADHARELSELIDAMSHGHRHPESAVPDHRHDLRLGSGIPAIKTSSKLAVLPALDPSDRGRAHDRLTSTTARYGPPATLFATHSSLLL